MHVVVNIDINIGPIPQDACIASWIIRTILEDTEERCYLPKRQALITKKGCKDCQGFDRY